MELYEIEWQEVSHIWKLYDKKFWPTRVVSQNKKQKTKNKSQQKARNHKIEQFQLRCD